MPTFQPAVVMASLLLLSHPAWADDRPPGPTDEQLRQAKADFDAVGAGLDLVVGVEGKTDPITKRPYHEFLMPAATDDSDLGKMPKPPFGYGLNFADTKVTDFGMRALRHHKNITGLGPWKTAVTNEGLEAIAELSQPVTGIPRTWVEFSLASRATCSQGGPARELFGLWTWPGGPSFRVKSVRKE